MLVLLLSTFLRFYRLGSDIFNDDAQFWYQRSTTFVDALAEKDWEDTFLNTKPGVTVQWLTGLSLRFFLATYKSVFGFKPLLYTAETFQWVDLAAKAPLVSFSILFLMVFYGLLRRWFDPPLALVATAFLGFEPFFIGISRWLHVEGLLAFFLPLSALFYLHYLWAELPRRRFLCLSGILGGLALLTKSTAIFLVLYLPLVFLVRVVGDIWENKGKLKVQVKVFLKDYFLWILLVVGTFVLLLPAVWVHPWEVVSRILRDIQYTGTVGRNNLEGPLFYLYALPMRMSPFLLVAFLGGLGYLGKVWGRLKQRQRFLLLNSFFFIFFFTLMMSLSVQKMERYLLVIYPFVAILGGWGVLGVLGKIGEKFQCRALVGFMVVLFAFALHYTPYFSAYYNPILGGRTQAEKMYRVESTGQLYPEVARWINSHPNPHDLVTVTNYNTHSLRPYILGKVFNKNENLPEGLKPDFFVVPWDQSLSLRYQWCEEKVHEVYFHQDLYWTIYKCKK